MKEIINIINLAKKVKLVELNNLIIEESNRTIEWKILLWKIIHISREMKRIYRQLLSLFFFIPEGTWLNHLSHFKSITTQILLDLRSGWRPYERVWVLGKDRFFQVMLCVTWSLSIQVSLAHLTDWYFGPNWHLLSRPKRHALKD